MKTCIRIIPSQGEKGFTLIEVLVASSLAIGLSIVVMTLAIQAQQMSAVMISKSQLNAEARLVFDMLGTGQAVDGGTNSGGTTNKIIEDTERSVGFREASSVALSQTPLLSSNTNSNDGAKATIADSYSSSEITVAKLSDVANTRSRFFIKPPTGSTLNIRVSSEANQTVPCRTSGQAPANPEDPMAGGPLVGDPYYDCAGVDLVSHGYVSYVIVDSINRSVSGANSADKKTVDVEYTLVDPRLAGWRDQAYTKWDYRETYRTSFLMNAN
ncbi:hypothetical protein CCP3SC15_200030 [Gammaproteobacteria bacterium]